MKFMTIFLVLLLVLLSLSGCSSPARKAHKLVNNSINDLDQDIKSMEDEVKELKELSGDTYKPEKSGQGKASNILNQKLGDRNQNNSIHITMTDESVLDIARKRGVSPEKIIKLNNIRPPYIVPAGIAIKIR